MGNVFKFIPGHGELRSQPPVLADAPIAAFAEGVPTCAKNCKVKIFKLALVKNKRQLYHYHDELVLSEPKLDRKTVERELMDVIRGLLNRSRFTKWQTLDIRYDGRYAATSYSTITVTVDGNVTTFLI